MARPTADLEAKFNGYVSPEEILGLQGLVTEDEEPVDNLFVERQQKLLTEPLRESWKSPDGLPFMAVSNVGLFYDKGVPPLVPDAMLSLHLFGLEKVDVQVVRSYFAWIFKKLPEIVVEIVSQTTNDEDSTKLRKYEQIGIRHYVIFDPLKKLSGELLRSFTLKKAKYVRNKVHFFADAGLGLKFWEGNYGYDSDIWLRWCDEEGRVIPTALEKEAEVLEESEFQRERAEREAERAEAEQRKAFFERRKTKAEFERAEFERRRADAEQSNAVAERMNVEIERQKTEAERLKAEAAEEEVRRLRERLRQMGIDP